MSHPSPSSTFQSLFNNALQDYQTKTGTRLIDHPLAKALEKCDSVGSITAVLQGQALRFKEYRGDNGKIMKSLKCTVQVLYTLSTITVLGEGIVVVRLRVFTDVFVPDTFSIASPCSESDICWDRYLTRCMSPFLFISLYLCDIYVPQAVKDVAASYDALVELLESFETFLGRLEIYTRIPPSEAAALGDIVVKILVELLSTLALATKQIKQGRYSGFVRAGVMRG
jgi:hypothetical protein